MGINRNNYEAYFLDYRENNLSAGQVAALMIFLEENPDLKTEFDLFDNIKLKPPKEIRYSEKEELKKSDIIATPNIDFDDYDEKLVANLEGDISEDENAELTAFMELNPKVKLEYNLYRSTFLKPDSSITFSNKESLKKKSIFVIYRTQLVYALSVAATVIVLLGTYFGFFYRPDEQAGRIQISGLNKLKIIQPGLPVIEPYISGIPEKKYFSVTGSAIDNTVFSDNRTAITGMDSQQIKAVEIPGNQTGYEQIIETRPIISYETALAVLDESRGRTNQKKEKTFIRRFISGIAKKFIDVEKPTNKSFLEYTIEGYNFIADRDVTVDKELDENGKVIAYRVNGENISLFRSNNH